MLRSTSDFIRTASQKAAVNIGMEKITWSKRVVAIDNLISVNSFPLLVCTAHRCYDDVTCLEAGMVLQLHGYTEGRLGLMTKCKVEEIPNVIEPTFLKTTNSLMTPTDVQFKSREISTIDEEDEVFEGSHLNQRGRDEDEFVLVCTAIEDGWLHPDEVLLLPGHVRPTFRLASRSPTMSENEWQDVLGMFSRSTRHINVARFIKFRAASVPYGNSDSKLQLAPTPQGGHLRSADLHPSAFSQLKVKPSKKQCKTIADISRVNEKLYSASSDAQKYSVNENEEVSNSNVVREKRVNQEIQPRESQTSFIVLNDDEQPGNSAVDHFLSHEPRSGNQSNLDVSKNQFQTRHLSSKSSNNINDVNSNNNNNDSYYYYNNNGISSNINSSSNNSIFHSNRPQHYQSCVSIPLTDSHFGLNESSQCFLSTSQISLSSSPRGGDILDVLRPRNYKRSPAEPVKIKPKSKFSLFRFRKSKQSKRESSEGVAQEGNIHTELGKTKRYVDLISHLGRPKSSNCSVIGSILNLSDISLLEDNSMLSTSHDMSYVTDDNSHARTKSCSQLETSPSSFHLERYVIRRVPPLSQQYQLPADGSIARKKQMKTNSRLQSKLGCQASSNCALDTDKLTLALNQQQQSAEVDAHQCSSKSVGDVTGFGKTPACRYPVSYNGHASNYIAGIITRPDTTNRSNSSGNQNDMQVFHCQNSCQFPPSIVFSVHPDNTRSSTSHSLIRTNPRLHSNKASHSAETDRQNPLKCYSDVTANEMIRLTNSTTNQPPPQQWSNRNSDNIKSEVIYENLLSLSDRSADSSLSPSKPLERRTNSAESSDFIASDASFGRSEESASLVLQSRMENNSLMNNKTCHVAIAQPGRKIKLFDDDGYQSRTGSSDFLNCSLELQRRNELVSYL